MKSICLVGRPLILPCDRVYREVPIPCVLNKPNPIRCELNPSANLRHDAKRLSVTGSIKPIQDYELQTNGVLVDIILRPLTDLVLSAGGLVYPTYLTNVQNHRQMVTSLTR